MEPFSNELDILFGSSVLLLLLIGAASINDNWVCKLRKYNCTSAKFGEKDPGSNPADYQFFCKQFNKAQDA